MIYPRKRTVILRYPKIAHPAAKIFRQLCKTVFHGDSPTPTGQLSDTPFEFGERLVCRLLDNTVAYRQELSSRFPDCPASKGKSSDTLVTFVKDRPGHDRRYAIDATKSEKELGYHPKESFETGIEKTVEWYVTNEEWWQAVMNGSYRKWLDFQYGN